MRVVAYKRLKLPGDLDEVPRAFRFDDDHPSSRRQSETRTMDVRARGFENHRHLTSTGYQAALTSEFHDEEVAELKLKRNGQVNALTGAQRTELKGNISGWDHYNYQVTLIRNHLEDWQSSRPGTEVVEGTVVLFTNADLDCYGQRMDAETLNCQVELTR